MIRISPFVPVGMILLLTVAVSASENRRHDTSGNISQTARQAGDDEAYRPRRKGVLTCNKDIARLMLSHSASCHRPGEIAPFSLMRYSDVKKRAGQIVEVTGLRLMPPWKADSHEEFEGENRLTRDQSGLIRQWVDEAAEGEAADLREMPVFTPGWKLGPPDAELAPENSFSLAASDQDEFRTFLLPTNYGEDRFLTTVDLRPGNSVIVHHAIVCVDTAGTFRKLAKETGRTDFSRGIGTPQGVLAVWTPGKIPGRLPPGVGMLLPKGADLVVEIHYHRTGKPKKDRTKVGLYFSKEPVSQLLHVFGLNAARISIAPEMTTTTPRARCPSSSTPRCSASFRKCFRSANALRSTSRCPMERGKP